MIVEKKVFELPEFRTSDGQPIKNVRIGWESYGALNEARSNAILIAHYFSGSSHAAGRYKKEDVYPGYWDALIGPGKAIDTGRYFVFSSTHWSISTPAIPMSSPQGRRASTRRPADLTGSIFRW